MRIPDYHSIIKNDFSQALCIMAKRWNFSQKNLMWGIGEHFRRYAHALRFAIGLHGA